MARFLGSVLRYLGSGYKISGSEVRTDQLDLGGVQLVQDVTSLVASGRGPGLSDGWFVGLAGVNVLADGSTTDELVELNPFPAPGGTITWWPPEGITDEFDLYLYRVWGEWLPEAAHNPQFTAMRLFYTTPARFAAAFAGTTGWPADHLHLLAHGSSLWSFAVNDSRQSVNLSSPVRTMDDSGPFYLPQGSRLWLRGIGSADANGGATAAVIRAIFLMRAVPRGFPPGP